MDLQKAMEFVVRCHSGQTRKGKRNGIALPYVTHCFEVFKVLWQCGACDEITGPAALGHDLLEECPDLDVASIQEHLGERATAVIRELTFIPDASSPIPTAEQKAAYLTGIRAKSVEAVVIKPCDRYVNVMDFLQDDPTYASKYLAKGEPIFDAVQLRQHEIDQRFGTGVSQRLLDLKADLQAKIALCLSKDYE